MGQSAITLCDKKKIAFLDRDGIVNVDRGYVHTISDFEFTKGFFEACKLLMSCGYNFAIVTNQSGIARGYYSQTDFSNLSNWLVKQFELNGLLLDAIYHCPHGADSLCTCRKPEPGMVLTHLHKSGAAAKNCIMFGDKPSDAACAAAAGLGRFFMIDIDTNPTDFYDTVINYVNERYAARSL